MTHGHRRSIRLKDYDYSDSGLYFVTICTQHRVNLFGLVTGGEMRLNEAGEMIWNVWEELAEIYPGVQTDAFVVMPNHIHGIIWLTGDPTSPDFVGASPRACPPDEVRHSLSLPDLVGRLKTMTTRRYIGGVREFNWPPFAGKLWQRNYFDHVIRNDRTLERLRTYISDNPASWNEDEENVSLI